jgi:antitoxin component YwqK of YwqJK toxin-antitoxin module
MKHRLTLSVFLLFFVSACKDVREEYYDTGELRGTLVYKDDMPNGPFEIYYKSGVVKETGTFLNGARHGENIRYDENGVKSVLTHYNKGVEHGESVSYYEDGSIESKVELVNGEMHGKLYSYFDSGEFESCIEYDNGFHHGNSKFFYENGTLRYEAKSVRDTTMMFIKYDSIGRAIEDFYVWNPDYDYMWEEIDGLLQDSGSHNLNLWFSSEEKFFELGQKETLQVDVSGVPKELLKLSVTNATIRHLPQFFRKYEVVAKKSTEPVVLTVRINDDTIATKKIEVRTNENNDN